MKKYRNYRSHFLFPVPSFLLGVARALDLSGQFVRYNESPTGEEADLRARICDWMVVQQDLNASWGSVVDSDPDFVQMWLEAVKKDPALLREYHRLASQEETHELEVATPA